MPLDIRRQNLHKQQFAEQNATNRGFQRGNGPVCQTGLYRQVQKESFGMLRSISVCLTERCNSIYRQSTRPLMLDCLSARSGADALRSQERLSHDRKGRTSPARGTSEQIGPSRSTHPRRRSSHAAGSSKKARAPSETTACQKIVPENPDQLGRCPPSVPRLVPASSQNPASGPQTSQVARWTNFLRREDLRGKTAMVEMLIDV